METFSLQEQEPSLHPMPLNQSHYSQSITVDDEDSAVTKAEKLARHGVLDGVEAPPSKRMKLDHETHSNAESDCLRPSTRKKGVAPIKAELVVLFSIDSIQLLSIFEANEVSGSSYTYQSTQRIRTKSHGELKMQIGERWQRKRNQKVKIITEVLDLRETKLVCVKVVSETRSFPLPSVNLETNVDLNIIFANTSKNGRGRT